MSWHRPRGSPPNPSVRRPHRRVSPRVAGSGPLDRASLPVRPTAVVHQMDHDGPGWFAYPFRKHLTGRSTMGLQQRGVIVDFDSRRRAVLAQRGLMQCVDARDDQEVNAAWDDLMKLVIQAWSWRDPESLDALETALGVLRQRIADDWQS